MTVKHTPGPWQIKRWPDTRLKEGFEVVITDRRGVGLVSFNQKGNSEKVLANARLIALAPQMKKSLEDFLSISHRLSGCSDPECSVCLANKRVIAEAELILLQLDR